MTYALTTPTRRQRGISLIESLIAIVVTALGILGILGVQMRTLSDTSTTVRRAQAIRLIEDLGERMRVNP
jgi:type IV pilus assembly protein PilV